MSQATSNGERLYCLRSKFANLPVVVVLPAPCRPTIIITVGERSATAILLCSPPIKFVNSSLTTLITCCPGVKLSITSCPTARSLIRLIKSLTTLKLTSASSKARRTSRVISLTSCSATFPLPVIFLIVLCKRSANPSNAMEGVPPNPILLIDESYFESYCFPLLHLLLQALPGVQRVVETSYINAIFLHKK